MLWSAALTHVSFDGGVSNGIIGSIYFLTQIMIFTVDHLMRDLILDKMCLNVDFGTNLHINVPIFSSTLVMATSKWLP